MQCIDAETLLHTLSLIPLLYHFDDVYKLKGCTSLGCLHHGCHLALHADALRCLLQRVECKDPGPILPILLIYLYIKVMCITDVQHDMLCVHP
jgi:hypothetical protein